MFTIVFGYLAVVLVIVGCVFSAIHGMFVLTAVCGISALLALWRLLSFTSEHANQQVRFFTKQTDICVCLDTLVVLIRRQDLLASARRSKPGRRIYVFVNPFGGNAQVRRVFQKYSQCSNVRLNSMVLGLQDSFISIIHNRFLSFFFVL